MTIIYDVKILELGVQSPSGRTYPISEMQKAIVNQGPSLVYGKVGMPSSHGSLTVDPALATHYVDNFRIHFDVSQAFLVGDVSIIDAGLEKFWQEAAGTILEPQFRPVLVMQLTQQSSNVVAQDIEFRSINAMVGELILEEIRK